MASEYAYELGSRLRAVRNQQRLSLHAVEQKSDGRLKAAVLGSYERGDRAVTVAKLAELADFYGVPLAELLPDGGAARLTDEQLPTVTVDLQRLDEIDDATAAPLARYAASLQSVRGDDNGTVLSIRGDDLRTLAVIYDRPLSSLAAELLDLGVFDDEAAQLVTNDV